jgi:hypothetical protein
MDSSNAAPVVLFGGMFICMLVPMILLIGMWIYALIDVLRRDFDGNDKIVWILVVVLCNWIGALIYLFVGRPRGRLPQPRGTEISPLP